MPTQRLRAASRAFVCSFALAAAAAAQTGSDAGLAAWREDHGSTWRVAPDPGTGRARLLFNGVALAAGPARTDADLAARAREFVARAAPLLGFEPATLVFDRVRYLPLGLAGSTDKVTVRFEQVVAGVPVRDASVNVLLRPDGALLAVDSVALPGVAGLSTTPSIPAGVAARVAAGIFERDAGGAAPAPGSPALEVEREDGRPVLVWRVEVLRHDPGAEPVGWAYRVAAQGSPRLVSREALVHRCDVGGTVLTMATPGTKPDETDNPEVAKVARYMTVSSAAGTTTTDENGVFLFPGAAGPLNVTFGYEGSFNDVNNSAGSEYQLVVSLPAGTGNEVLLNPSGSAAVTAQANAFVEINALRDWTRAINPADSTADFVATANVNVSQTCNATYSGSQVNFYAAGGGCPNTAYASIIAHEVGHWLNVKYGSGNGPDGFGEGNSDVFAMYRYDTPFVGDGFFGPGTVLRDGNNTVPFCGDQSSGCHGGVHDNGEVLMGALWKVRDRLNQSLGDVQGDLTADLLFNSWMNAFDDGQIKSIIETHWLLLDDDDGVLENGTPHHPEIDGGFLAQGFPGHAISYVNFDAVIAPLGTLDQVGPYGVAADLVPFIHDFVAGATVYWSVDGGPLSEAPMANVGGDTWTALLPGVQSPVDVDLYLEAFDDQGGVNVYPPGAPGETLSFHVGQVTTWYFDDFETGDDNGWTHVAILAADDWQHGVPSGAGGESWGINWQDPPAAYSGTRCWGNDLGPVSPFWGGQYTPNEENMLRSPVIDLSQASGTQLRFRRWLSVQKALFDQASVRVNGVDVWNNPVLENVLDTSWEEVEIDISALVDGVPAVRLDWHLRSNIWMELGGWNIDDVHLLSFDPSPTDCLPTAYGAGTPGSFGVPALDSAGQPARVGNASFEARLKGGPPHASALLAAGFASASVPILGGTLLVLPSEVASFVLDVFGQGSAPFPLPDNPGLAGLDLFFQGAIVDPGGPEGFALTAGMRATLCP